METKTAEGKFIYTIDFQPVKYYRDLYKCINDGFELTGMVGENLDALWDTLTGFIGWPCEIRFTNLSTLNKQRREELQDILLVFKQAEKTYPENIRVLLEDESYLQGAYEYIIKLAVANDDVWKIMKEANHLHEALKSGLGLS